MTRHNHYLDGARSGEQAGQKAAQLATGARAKTYQAPPPIDQPLPSAYLKRIQAGQQDQARAPYQHATSVCPRCFTPEQWVLWRTPHNSVRVPAKHYCEDCTPDYQEEMQTAHRCEHSEVIFIRDADGFISGHRPPQKEQP